MSLPELAGLLALVVLVLVGSLMPLRYTARMRLPKPPDRPASAAGREPRGADGDERAGGADPPAS